MRKDVLIVAALMGGITGAAAAHAIGVLREPTVDELHVDVQRMYLHLQEAYLMISPEVRSTEAAPLGMGLRAVREEVTAYERQVYGAMKHQDPFRFAVRRFDCMVARTPDEACNAIEAVA